jgi:DNA-binding transcriptional regulator YiaG
LTTLIRGQLLGIAHRTALVNFSHFKQRFSPRKPIPANPKSLGDYIHLKRIEADFSQPELAQKTGVTVRKVKAWEYDQRNPTEAEWHVLMKTLKLEMTARPAIE